MAFKHAVDERDYGAVGAIGVAPAFKDAGVARLEAERENVETDVWPGLIDDTYYAERHADTPQAQAVLKRPGLRDDAERRRQRGHMAHVSGYVGEPFFR